MKCLQCLPCCKKNKSKVTNKDEEEEAIVPDEPAKNRDQEVGYNQMQKLKDDLDEAHKKLRRQMKDKDKKRAEARIDEDGNPGKFIEPEDELIEELIGLKVFMKDNIEVIKGLNILKPKEGDWFMADEDKDALKAETIEVVEKQEKITNLIEMGEKQIQKIVNQQLENEANNELKVQKEQAELRQKQFEQELEKNDKLKQDMIDKFKEQIKNSNLTPAEQAAMLAEMNAKISSVNDMISIEEKSQNDMLDEALARRRAKKLAMRDMMDGVADKKGQLDGYYTQKMDEIADKEKQELEKIEPEIQHERVKFLKAINIRLDQKRTEMLTDSEKRLNEFRKKTGQNDPDEFADMIAQYGDQVKRVDSLIELEKEKERKKMEEELARRKAERITNAKSRRKEREDELLKETGESRGAKQEEMKAVLGLIKPIQDEDIKIARVLKDIQEDKAIIRPEDYDLD